MMRVAASCRRLPSSARLSIVNRCTWPAGAAVSRLILPSWRARKRVQGRACRAFWKAYGRKRDMAFENAGETVAHFRRRRARDHGAGDIGGAVGILTAGIDQEDFVAFDRAVAGARHAIVGN